MINRFKSFSFSNLTILFFLLIILNLYPFFGSKQVITSQLSILSPLFASKNIFWQHFTFIFLLIAETVYFIYITQKFEIGKRNSLVSSIIFVVLTGYADSQGFSPVLFAVLFYLSAFWYLINAIEAKQNPKPFFYSGLLFFLSAMFYYPVILIIIFIPVIIIILRQKFTKELLAFYLAILVSFVLLLEILWLINGELNFIENIKEAFLSHLSKDFALFEKIYLTVILIYLLLATFFLTQNLGQQEIRLRLIYKISIVLLVFGVSIFFVPSACKELWQIIIIPLSLLIGYYFDFSKVNKFKKIIFWLFILLPFIYQALLFLSQKNIIH